MISSLVLGSVSAMEMMDSGSMMKEDKMTMSSDGMMKKDTMMMKSDSKMMAKKSTAALAKSMGYTWSIDRVMLAEKAGVTGYTGTAKQNLMIRKYLMSMKTSMMKDDKMMGDTMTK